jgi:hypothetical protein
MSLVAAVLSSGSGSSTLSQVEPGLLGFLVVAGLVVALVFLLRSMNKQLRKIPPPQEPDTGGTRDGDLSAVADGAAAADSAPAEPGNAKRG